MGESKYENLGLEYPLKGLEAMNSAQAEEAHKLILFGMKDRILNLKSRV